jgi:hypothetical protein
LDGRLKLNVPVGKLKVAVVIRGSRLLPERFHMGRTKRHVEGDSLGVIPSQGADNIFSVSHDFNPLNNHRLEAVVLNPAHGKTQNLPGSLLQS